MTDYVDVILTAVNARERDVVFALRAATAEETSVKLIDRDAASRIASSVPSVVAERVPLEVGTRIMDRLAAAGATVEIRRP